MIPAGYANGGKVKPFSGADTKGEEMAEAREVRSGKVSPKQYVERETAEHKREGEYVSKGELAKRGQALASGKMSPAKYAAMEGMEKKADGGMVGGCTAAGYASSLNGKHMGK